jgi:hypothetical protein
MSDLWKIIEKEVLPDPRDSWYKATSIMLERIRMIVERELEEKDREIERLIRLINSGHLWHRYTS